MRTKAVQWTAFGTLVCLIETHRVDFIPFRDIADEVAAEEGEGELTLSDWKKGHQAFFERAAAELDMAFTADANIFIERFRLVKVFGG